MMQDPNAIKFDTRNIDIAFIIFSGISLILFAVLVSLGQFTTSFYILGGGLALVLALIVFFQPQFGGYLLVITVFSTLSDIVVENGYPSITKPLLAVIFISVIANNILRRKVTNNSLSLSKVEIFLFGYLLVSWASIPFAVNRSQAISEGIDLVKEFIIVFSIILTLVRWGDWKRAVWIIFIIVFALALIGSIQSIFQIYENEFLGFGKIYVDYISDYEDQFRIMGPLDDPNYWGMVLVSVIPLGIYRILDEKKFVVRAISFFMTAVILFAMLNTYSRGAFVALVFTLVLIAIERKLSLPLMVFIGLSTILLVLIAPSGYIERVQSLSTLINPNNSQELFQDRSFRGRYSELIVGIEMFMDEPVLGIGIGNFEENYQSYAKYFGIETRSEQRESHSLYIEILAETGILGFIFFMGMIINLVRDNVRLRKFVLKEKLYRPWASWLSSVTVSVITYLVASIFLHGAYMRFFWVFFALALAATHIGKKIGKFNQYSTTNPEM